MDAVLELVAGILLMGAIVGLMYAAFRDYGDMPGRGCP